MGLSISEGFHAVNVYIVVGDSVEALALYEKAFGAQTRMRMPGPDGEGTVHAEFRIGDLTVMMTFPAAKTNADGKLQAAISAPSSVNNTKTVGTVLRTFRNVVSPLNCYAYAAMYPSAHGYNYYAGPGSEHNMHCEGKQSNFFS